MTIPSPLPTTLPIGTKIKYAGREYQALVIGKLNQLNHYEFSSCKNITFNYDTGCITFAPSDVMWEENSAGLTLESTEASLIIHCNWCYKEIDNGMNVCSSHKSKCGEYWDALTERMKLNYLKPTDALEYDRTCVKKFVDNKNKIMKK